MKQIYLAVAVLLLVPILSYAYQGYTEGVLEKAAEAVVKAAEAANPEEAESYLLKAEKTWEGIRNFLAASSHHSAIEEINKCFVRAKAWLQTGEKSMLVSELKWLDKQIRHVYEMEVPTMYNIF